MAIPVDSIVDVRKAVMVASTEGDYKPVLRTAHFLKPTLLNGDPPPLSPSSLPISSDPSKLPLKVEFKKWLYHPDKWSEWVDQMEADYSYVWKKVGIFDAVKASVTSRIKKDSNLILEVAQKWSPETNTFIFRWGEATVTLEDVNVIGGYSVLGSPVSTPLETDKMAEIVHELERTRAGMAREKCKKAGISPWMKKFMGRGSKVEHEAFLACWLSCFVFNNHKSKDTIIKGDVFKVAVHLAGGTRIALAPAVLASIYRDLTIIKKHVYHYARVEIKGGEPVLPVWTPFVLVQAWIWERFPSLRPIRAELRLSEPWIATWRDNHRTPLGTNISSALGSGKFHWSPYTEPLINTVQNEDSEKWVSIDGGTREELLSFAKFLIPSQLVGLDGSVEHYFPHRVSMQFGFDQDLPGNVIFCDLDCEVFGKSLYVPSVSFEPSVTDRYRIWWEKMKHGAEAVEPLEGIPDSLRDLVRHLRTTVQNPMNDAVLSPSPPGFKRKVTELYLSDEEDQMTLKELFCSNSKVKSFKSMSSQDVPPSCAGSSNAKDMSMGKNNLLEEEEEEVIEEEEEVVELTNCDKPDDIEVDDQPNGIEEGTKSAALEQRSDFSASASCAEHITMGNNNLLEKVEIIDLTNCDEPDIEVDDRDNGVEGTKSAALEQRNNFSARINSIWDELTNVQRDFAEVKAARLAGKRK